LNGFEMYIFNKKVIEMIIFGCFMLRVIKYIILELASIMVQRFINRLFMKLIILCKSLLNVSHIQKGYQNDII
jgi:hypothetical protein